MTDIVKPGDVLTWGHNNETATVESVERVDPDQQVMVALEGWVGLFGLSCFKDISPPHGTARLKRQRHDNVSQ